MNSKLLESVAQDLFSIPPLIGRSVRRKLLKSPAAGLPAGLSLAHVQIMKTLQLEGPLHMTGIGQRLLIRGPQMTHLIDGLAEKGLVRRSADTEDRRAVRVLLTDSGREFLDEHDRIIVDGLRKTLSALTAEELGELSASLRSVRDILSKLE